MKLSAGTIGTVLFTVAGIAVFVLMAKRPVVDGGAMNFGMPLSSSSVKAETMPEVTTTPDEAPATSTPEATAPTESVTPEPEPVKTEEVITESAISATTEEAMPASTDTETKVEDEPATMPASAPTTDGSMPAN
jgi:hypothetical protein